VLVKKLQQKIIKCYARKTTEESRENSKKRPLKGRFFIQVVQLKL